MDTLIARFVKYIEEEAPKNSDPTVQNKIKSLTISGEFSKEDKKGSAENEVVKSDVNSEQYKDIVEKCNKLELKLKTTKEYLENILSHTEVKYTGLEKKPVIELPIGDINGYRKYLKTL